ncbi:MAG: pyridine nucleotide-disulfide oxidoreductase [Sulfuricaulis sp.]
MAAWAVRNGNYYKPSDNFGYYLGVVGGLMMLILLLYSLRKHVRFMRNWGPTRHWFRLHMILGIAGPTLILFHSTFHVGSMNAAVALWCMLLVAGSGIIGRFIYRKIHHGLYGRSSTLQEIQQNLGIIQGDVKSKFDFSPIIEQRLRQFEAAALAEHASVWARIRSFLFISFYANWTYFRSAREMERLIRQHARSHGWDVAKRERRLAHGKMAIRKYLNATVDVARFSTYERLFSLWHILHVPFVFMLVISGVVHVIAVHMY